MLNAPNSTVGRALLQLARLLKLRVLALLRPPQLTPAAPAPAALATANGGAGGGGAGGKGGGGKSVLPSAAEVEAGEARFRAAAARLTELGATQVLRDEGPIHVSSPVLRVCALRAHFGVVGLRWRG